MIHTYECYKIVFSRPSILFIIDFPLLYHNGIGHQKNINLTLFIHTEFKWHFGNFGNLGTLVRLKFGDKVIQQEPNFIKSVLIRCICELTLRWKTGMICFISHYAYIYQKYRRLNLRAIWPVISPLWFFLWYR